MTTITGSFKSSTGINSSTGPPMRDDVVPMAQINVVELTETEFAALEHKVPNTIYVIT